MVGVLSFILFIFIVRVTLVLFPLSFVAIAVKLYVGVFS